MKFKISKEIFEKFPGLNLGIVICRGIDNTRESKEIEDLLRAIEKETAENFANFVLAEHSHISPWRKAYSSFGAKPKKYKCSVEALVKRCLSGEPIPLINKLVDMYNYESLKHILPMGGDDLDKVEGDVELKIANGDEKFTELNSTEVKNPKQGEVVYSDSKEVLCRRWNWRECDKTKLTSDSKNVIIYVEGLPPIGKGEVDAALKELSENIVKFCKGNTESYILNKENPEIDIEV